jgi:hypothetical protein
MQVCYVIIFQNYFVYIIDFIKMMYLLYIYIYIYIVILFNFAFIVLILRINFINNMQTF